MHKISVVYMVIMNYGTLVNGMGMLFTGVLS